MAARQWTFDEASDAGPMRPKTVVALALDADGHEALQHLRQRVADWAIPVQWFDDNLYGIPLVTVPRAPVRWGLILI